MSISVVETLISGDSIMKNNQPVMIRKVGNGFILNLQQDPCTRGELVTWEETYVFQSLEGDTGLFRFLEFHFPDPFKNVFQTNENNSAYRR